MNLLKILTLSLATVKAQNSKTQKFSWVPESKYPDSKLNLEYYTYMNE